MEAKNTRVEMERVEIRLSPEDKMIIKRALEISGEKTMSGFIKRVVKEEARFILSGHGQILESERDRELFFRTVFENSPEPNDNLIAATKRLKALLPAK